jgi:hypothetical protein
VPLLALSLAVIVPAVVAQHSGQLEPLLFEVSLCPAPRLRVDSF